MDDEKDMTTEDWKQLQRELDAMIPQPGEVWRHFKGTDYLITGHCIIEQGAQPAICYRTGNGNELPFVRPVHEFYDVLMVFANDPAPVTLNSKPPLSMPTKMIRRFVKVDR